MNNRLLRKRCIFEINYFVCNTVSCVIADNKSYSVLIECLQLLINLWNEIFQECECYLTVQNVLIWSPPIFCLRIILILKKNLYGYPAFWNRWCWKVIPQYLYCREIQQVNFVNCGRPGIGSEKYSGCSGFQRSRFVRGCLQIGSKPRGSSFTPIINFSTCLINKIIKIWRRCILSNSWHMNDRLSCCD